MTLSQALCQGTECTTIHQNWEDVNNKMASSSAPGEGSTIQFDSCSWIPYVYTLVLQIPFLDISPDMHIISKFANIMCIEKFIVSIQ